MELGPIQLKWVEALEAHPERQTKNLLGQKNHDGTYTACCLGEGGLIAGVCKWDGNTLKAIGVDGNPVSTYALSGDAYKALGLRNSNGATITKEDENHLTFLNDGGKTWPEIAKLLREKSEEYFTHSI